MHDQPSEKLNAMISIAPTEELTRFAKQFFEKREVGKSRGHLRGIPIVFKDSIGTVLELHMPTTCASYTLLESRTRGNSEVV